MWARPSGRHAIVVQYFTGMATLGSAQFDLAQFELAQFDRAQFVRAQLVRGPRISRIFRAWLVCVGLLLASCESTENYTLQVQLRTDLLVGREFEAIELTLLPVDELGTSKRSFTPAGTEGYLPQRTVAELSVMPDGYRLGVSLLDASGASLIERPVLLDVRENLSVTVPITRSCLNVQCPDGDACFAGQCVDPRCSVEAPEFCGDGVLCDEDAECTSVASCAQGLCLDRVCWATPRESSEEDACDTAAGEFCDPDRGCVGAGPRGPEEVVVDGKSYTVSAGYRLSAVPLAEEVRQGLRDFVFDLAVPPVESAFEPLPHIVFTNHSGLSIDREGFTSLIRVRSDGSLESLIETSLGLPLGLNPILYATMVFTGPGDEFDDEAVICTGEIAFQSSWGTMVRVTPAGDQILDADQICFSALTVDRGGVMNDGSERRAIYIPEFSVWPDGDGVHRILEGGENPEVYDLPAGPVYAPASGDATEGSLAGYLYALALTLDGRGAVYRLNASGAEPFFLEVNGGPIAMAVADRGALKDRIYISFQNERGSLRAYHPDGTFETVMEGLGDPRHLALDPSGDTLWIFENSTGQLLAIKSDALR